MLRASAASAAPDAPVAGEQLAGVLPVTPLAEREADLP